jgi:hypothetical protein
MSAERGRCNEPGVLPALLESWKQIKAIDDPLVRLLAFLEDLNQAIEAEAIQRHNSRESAPIRVLASNIEETVTLARQRLERLKLRERKTDLRRLIEEMQASDNVRQFLLLFVDESGKRLQLTEAEQIEALQDGTLSNPSNSIKQLRFKANDQLRNTHPSPLAGWQVVQQKKVASLKKIG